MSTDGSLCTYVPANVILGHMASNRCGTIDLRDEYGDISTLYYDLSGPQPYYSILLPGSDYFVTPRDATHATMFARAGREM